MFKNNKKVEINRNNNYESLDTFLKNSKNIFKELISIYNIKESNENQNLIFKYLSNIQFGMYILPYLSLKEILYLRATNKEINILINSNIYCINYYIKTLKHHISFNDQINLSHNRRKLNSQLKPFHELNEESEFLEQKNILNKIKNYIKSPNFSLEYLIQIYRVEMDYLKYEENHQERYMNSLIETQKKINEESQLILGKNKKREGSWVNINKDEIFEKSELNDKNMIENLSDEELKKKIQELKMRKENLLFKLNNAKKTNEELNYKNEEKKKILNKLNNLCKIKEIEDDNNEIDNNEIDNNDLEEVNNFLKNL